MISSIEIIHIHNSKVRIAVFFSHLYVFFNRNHTFHKTINSLGVELCNHFFSSLLSFYYYYTILSFKLDIEATLLFLFNIISYKLLLFLLLNSSFLRGKKQKLILYDSFKYKFRYIYTKRSIIKIGVICSFTYKNLLKKAYFYGIYSVFYNNLPN